MTKSRELSGMICAVLSAVLFGTMPLMAKIAFSMGSNAYTVASGRFFTGALFSGLFLLIRGGSGFRISKEQLRNIAVLSVVYSAVPCLLYGSYQFIGSGLATTLHFTYPVIVMLLSALLFHSKVSHKSILCIIVCILGILCLYQPGGGNDFRGVLLAAVSGVVYAVYVEGVEKSGLKKLPVMTFIFWLSLFSAVEVTAFSAFTHKLILDLPLQIWIPYCGLGMIAMVIAAPLFQLGIVRCGAVKSSMLSTTEPVIGVLVGALVFNEILTVRSTVGIMLILLAVFVLAAPDHPVHGLHKHLHTA